MNHNNTTALHNELECAQRAQTSAKASNVNQHWSWIRLIRIRMSGGSLAECNAFILLSASVISPSIVKLAGDCMKNANKSPKIPYSEMVTKK